MIIDTADPPRAYRWAIRTIIASAFIIGAIVGGCIAQLI